MSTTVEIIQRRQTVEYVEVTHEFRWRETPSAGFGFNLSPEGEPVQSGGIMCYEDGRVVRWGMEPMNDAAAANLVMCLENEKGELVDLGIHVHERARREPAIGRCACGEEVTLDRFTNTCHRCGRDYNMSGSLLAPREQWGEETGEHWADIVNMTPEGVMG